MTPSDFSPPGGEKMSRHLAANESFPLWQPRRQQIHRHLAAEGFLATWRRWIPRRSGSYGVTRFFATWRCRIRRRLGSEGVDEFLATLMAIPEQLVDPRSWFNSAPQWLCRHEGAHRHFAGGVDVIIAVIGFVSQSGMFDVDVC